MFQNMPTKLVQMSSERFAELSASIPEYSGPDLESLRARAREGHARLAAGAVTVRDQGVASGKERVAR